MLLQVRSPYSQEIVAELALDDDATIDGKIAKATAAQTRWCRVPLTERLALLKAGLTRLRRDAEDVAREVSLQMGKPIREARGEFSTMLDRAEYMMGIASEALAPERLEPLEGFERRIEHVPLGVVFNVAAWNYPLIIPINVIVPALLAGNAVLLKHSAKTPLCGRRFEAAFGELGFTGLLTHLITDHAGTEKVIADPRVRHLSFTGSVSGGRHVYRVAAAHLLDAGLELGGKDPAYIAADADPAVAFDGVVEGACYNAGQSCCAVERVYVHESLYEPFLERARHQLGQYRLGDPLSEETTMGPLTSEDALASALSQVEDAERRGARLLCGGHRHPEHSASFLTPTLLAEAANDTLVMQEESFAPIVPVLKVGSDEEALEKMSDTRFGLTASVWTTDADRAEHLASQLDFGTVYQNRCDYLDPALPWTGVGESGMGSTLSRHGFFHLTRRKSIHFRR